METLPFKFSDDSPKQNPWRDDRLGFKPFVQRLSKVILSMSAPNGYVIGLQGEWGSGKSTIINFLKEFLQKHNIETEDEAERIEVVDFRPWMISGHHDLISAFFKVLSERLPAANKGARLRKVGGFVRGKTDPVLDAVAKLGVTLDPTFGLATSAASKMAGASINGAIDRFLKEPSLQTAYERLHKLLQEQPQRFLVIIDDIDRLRKDEIRSIMQMVKTVGRLPSIIYLLSYDRQIVWAALDEDGATNVSNPSFGEKIIQHEVVLPRPPKDELLKLLGAELAFLDVPDNQRRHFLLQDGVRRWIKQPRDVHRLANAVKFSWPALEGEIDPGDLLTMEGLRLFDERAFSWVRQNRDWLFGEGPFLMADEKVRKAALDPFIEATPKPDQQQLTRLLSGLFPRRAPIFGQMIARESDADTRRRRGVGSKAGYDAYFSLYLSPNAVSKVLIEGIFQRLNDKDFLVRSIEEHIDKKDRDGLTLVGELLGEIAIRFTAQQPPRPTQELLDAMMSVGERLLAIEWGHAIFRLSPRGAWEDLVHSALLAWGPSDASTHLKKAFQSASSLSLCATVFVQRAREVRKIPGDTQYPPVIAEDALQPLGKLLLPMIEKAQYSDQLLDAPRVWDVLVAWKYLDSYSNQVRYWLNKSIFQSARLLANVTETFVSWPVGTEPKRYAMGSAPDPTLYDYKALLRASLRHQDSPELSPDDQNRIRVVAEWLKHAIERQRREKADQLMKETAAEREARLPRLRALRKLKREEEARRLGTLIPT